MYSIMPYNNNNNNKNINNNMTLEAYLYIV